MIAGNPARSLLILPLNLAALMPEELEPARPIVWAELEAYLRAHGKDLRTVSFADARRLWLASIREVRSRNSRAGYDEASHALVGKLTLHADFDAVIAPSIFVREAKIDGKSASWDGVERELEIELDARVRLPKPLPLDGVAPAASFHAVVLGPDGSKQGEGVGGLELLVGARVLRKRDWATDAVTVEFVPRVEPFSSREHLLEGISKALGAFLPPLLPAEVLGRAPPGSP